MNWLPAPSSNVMLFADENVRAYSQTKLPATPDNQEKLQAWIQPFNTSASTIGVSTNMQLKNNDIAPMMGDLRNWPKAVQIALEQEVDNMFLLSASRWQFHPRSLQTETALKEWLEEQDWGERTEARWQERLAEAEHWLNNENRKRQDKGLAPRMVPGLDIIVREFFPRQHIKPMPAYNPDEVLTHIRNVNKRITANSIDLWLQSMWSSSKVRMSRRQQLTSTNLKSWHPTTAGNSAHVTAFKGSKMLRETQQVIVNCKCPV